MSEQCTGTVWDGWRDHKCSKPAKVERDGRWYCGVHDPKRPDKLAKAAEAQARFDTAAALRRRDHAIVRACEGLDLPDNVPAGALTALVAACRPFAALAPAFGAMGGPAQRRDDTEVYRAHWDKSDPDGKAITNGDFRAVAAALNALEHVGA